MYLKRNFKKNGAEKWKQGLPERYHFNGQNGVLLKVLILHDGPIFRAER